MNKSISILVTKRHPKECDKQVELYRNTIFLDDCLEAPFPLLLTSLKVLYPSAERIQFNVSL